MFTCTSNIFIDSIYKKDEKYYPKVFLEKYYFVEDRNFNLILIYSNSDEAYYDEECINLFLETLKSSFLRYKFFKLGA